VIFAAENSNKFQKTRFWKEESVVDVMTLGPTAQATPVPMMGEICCKAICNGPLEGCPKEREAILGLQWGESLDDEELGVEFSQCNWRAAYLQ